MKFAGDGPAVVISSTTIGNAGIGGGGGGGRGKDNLRGTGKI